MTARVTTDRRLTLDPGARIITSDDGLHILHRRGLFDLRGKGLAPLHDRLAPALNGRWTRAQVLAATRPQDREVGRYLDGLRESGVLLEGACREAATGEDGFDEGRFGEAATREGVVARGFPAGLPARFPAPAAGVQALTLGRTRVAVTLAGDGDESSDAGALRLSFASRAAIERRLLELEDPRSDGGRIWIACDSGDERRHEELDRRAAIARHLLAIECGREHADRVSIFALASDRCALERLAAAATPSTSLGTLPGQLSLVRLLERPQLPLVSMVAELRGLGRRGIGYGLDSTQIKVMLMRTVIGREALLQRIDAGTVAAAYGYAGHPASAGPEASADAGADVRLTREQGLRAAIAASPIGRDEALLGMWALQRSTGSAGRAIDLLAVEAPSTRVAVLQDALRRRLAAEPAIPALLDDRLSPLFVLRSPFADVARLGLEETLAEALMRAAAHSVALNADADADADAGAGVDAPAALPCAPSRKTPTRRHLAAVGKQLPGPVRVITGAFNFLGTTLHVGLLADADADTNADGGKEAGQ